MSILGIVRFLWWRWWVFAALVFRPTHKLLSQFECFSSVHHIHDGPQRSFILLDLCGPWWRWWDSILARTTRSVIRGSDRYQRSFTSAPTSNPFLYGTLNAPLRKFRDVSSPMVEMMGFEPMTPCLQGRCSPSWATPPSGCSCSPSFLYFQPLLFSEEWRVKSEEWKGEIFLRKISGRPKWTRTTDLVLIRHAL